MQKSILIFSNGEKIGDGIIKLPLLSEIKRRLPNYKIVWMTNKGKTVYNNQLKNIASLFIDEIIEEVDLKPFFWQSLSKNKELKKLKFNYILDTQKAVLRTIALKRIKCSVFISSSANYLFSNIKGKKQFKNKFRKYYLEDLFDLLNLIKKDIIDKNFKIPIPLKLENLLKNIFNKNNKYIGIAPGAGEKNKIWPLDNFIKVAKYYEKKSYKLVFFLGPEENLIKNKIINIFPNAIYPEENISGFSGPEIVMASTKFLSCALSNDSGVSHMLSTNFCPIIKLFGPKDPLKFTPKSNMIHIISSEEFKSNKIQSINSDVVIERINDLLL